MRFLVGATVAVALTYVAWNDRLESLIPKVESQAVVFSLENIDNEAALTARLDGAGSTAGYLPAVVAGLPARVRASIVIDGESVEQTIGSTCRRLNPRSIDTEPAIGECR